MAKSGSHCSCIALIRLSSCLYSFLKSSSEDYSNLIKSSTGPSASIYKAMVASKVFPYLLFSIFYKVDLTASSSKANLVAIKQIIANMVNDLILFFFYFINDILNFPVFYKYKYQKRFYFKTILKTIISLENYIFCNSYIKYKWK